LPGTTSEYNKAGSKNSTCYQSCEETNTAGFDAEQIKSSYYMARLLSHKVIM